MSAVASAIPENNPLPFSYKLLEGRNTILPLYQYQHLCLALEILEQRLADEDGCINASHEPELGEVHQALMLAVIAHPDGQDKNSNCNIIQRAVSARFKSQGVQPC